MLLFAFRFLLGITVGIVVVSILCAILAVVWCVLFQTGWNSIVNSTGFALLYGFSCLAGFCFGGDWANGWKEDDFR